MSNDCCGNCNNNCCEDVFDTPQQMFEKIVDRMVIYANDVEDVKLPQDLVDKVKNGKFEFHSLIDSFSTVVLNVDGIQYVGCCKRHPTDHHNSRMALSLCLRRAVEHALYSLWVAE